MISLPRLRGRVGGPRRESELVESPLTPTLSPQAGRGRRGATPNAIAVARWHPAHTRRICGGPIFEWGHHLYYLRLGGDYCLKHLP